MSKSVVFLWIKLSKSGNIQCFKIFLYLNKWWQIVKVYPCANSEVYSIQQCYDIKCQWFAVGITYLKPNTTLFRFILNLPLTFDIYYLYSRLLHLVQKSTLINFSTSYFSKYSLYVYFYSIVTQLFVQNVKFYIENFFLKLYLLSMRD